MTLLCNRFIGLGIFVCFLVGGCTPETAPSDTDGASDSAGGSDSHNNADILSDGSDSHSRADIVPEDSVKDAIPSDTIGDKKWQAVSVGEYHTVALDLDGKLHC